MTFHEFLRVDFTLRFAFLHGRFRHRATTAGGLPSHHAGRANSPRGGKERGQIRFGFAKDFPPRPPGRFFKKLFHRLHLELRDGLFPLILCNGRRFNRRLNFFFGMPVFR